MLLRRTLYSALLLLLYLPMAMNGQEVLSYEGPKQLGLYQGQANYQYQLIEGDTLLDGPFQMQRSNLESLLEKEDYSFLFKGAFENDYPIGPWVFQFATYQSTNQSRVVDYQYRVLVSGTQEDANGLIRMGRPQGLWTYTVNQIKDSEVEKLLFKSSITFENGIPQRSFRIENENSTLVGRFLRNGLAHDQWSLFSTNGIDAEENWLFDDGVLKQIEISQGDSNQIITIFGSAAGAFKSIPLGLQYIDALKLHLETQNQAERLPKGVQLMLAENASYYQKIDTILSELGKSDFSPKFKVKVPHFPLDSLEQVQLDSIKALYYKSKKVSGRLLDDTQLNILKLSDQEANFQYKVLKTVSERLLDPTQQLLDYEYKGILEFIAREQLVTKLWPNGMPQKNIEIAVDSSGTQRVFAVPDSARFAFNGKTMASIKSLVAYASASIDSIQTLLNTKLAKEQRQQELISIEAQLILQNKKLHQIIDSAKTNASAKAQEALAHIERATDKMLADYSAMQEVEAKLQYAQELVECYAQLQSLADAIAALPNKWQTIQEKYQDRVWNPFMATLMDEEVKKRITGAYRKVLVPYFLDQAKTNPPCDHVVGLVDMMKKTYQRMLQLRDEDTSKLERKLRREQDPRVVIQLFNLQSIDQD